jgi:uncharacterized protein YcbK (DUF882 family)
MHNKEQRIQLPDRQRRALLAGAAALVPLALAAPWGRARAARPERGLSFRHLHTGERLSVTYYAEGDYVAESLSEVDRLLRDFRTGEVHPIDPALLDILHDLTVAVERRGRTLDIISGYRSPKTNAMLRKRSSGVAKRSLHMQGRAIDVRLPGLDTARLRKAAVGMGRGGVGYYRKSDFVHLDTGRFRTW